MERTLNDIIREQEESKEEEHWCCFYCGWYGVLDEDEDECPYCGEGGYLEPKY